ncbi:MAG: hypothetical protein R2741_12905 [Methanolobus sp.]
MWLGERFASYITDVSYEVNRALDEGKNVLAEGAQEHTWMSYTEHRSS